MKKLLHLDDISLTFGENVLFEHLSEVFEPGIYAFSGPSGVGKSTLMRMIAGLETKYTGKIELVESQAYCKCIGENYDCAYTFLDKTASKTITSCCPEIHMVHQHYKSYPWLSCVDNVLMVHKGHKVKVTPEHVEEAKEVLTRLGLGEHFNKRPNQLSGGQDQRLSLASAFVNAWSNVVMYDEPTSALDDLNDMLVVDLIKEHQAKYNTIEIIITHESHVIKGLDPVIIEFSPEYRLRKNPFETKG